MSTERFFFEAGDDDLGIQIVAFVGADKAQISCNDDWAGDTETGFGATVTVEITREEAKKLIEYLNKWLSN